MLDLLPSRKVTRFLPRAEEVVVELDGSMARKRATRDMWVGRQMIMYVCLLLHCTLLLKHHRSGQRDLDLDAESSFPHKL